MATPRVTNRYPRPGQRVAPSTLREFFTEPIPKRLRKKAADASLKLYDLDETVWERLPPELILELSQVVVDRVATCHARQALQDCRFPRPPKRIRLEDLQLENRTRRCLAREGFEDRLEALGDYTIGKILAIRAFGPRCLVDLLCALESPASRGRAGGKSRAKRRGLSEKLSSQARRLSKLSDAQLARREDPRFTRLMDSLDSCCGGGSEARTAKELAEQLLARTEDPAEPAQAAEQVQRLASRIEGMPKLTLEEELIQIFGSTPYERNRQILIGYYGWDDGRQHTLTEVGTRFGITRERIRQVCAKLTKKHKDAGKIVAPVMDRVLALVEKRLPCSAAEFQAELTERKLTAVGMQMENIATSAKLLDRPVAFRIVKADTGRLAVRAQQVNAALAIIDLAKKETYFHGLTTVASVEKAIAEKFPDAVCPELVIQALRLVEGFSWLDEQSGWFRLLSISKHGLPKAIDKILAVAGSVTVAEMHKAMSRNRRLWKEPPPENVLLEFCRQTKGVRVRGNRIIADPPRDWRKSLTGVEAQLVRVLEKHGPVMERGAMEDVCVAGGMNRFSFHAFVSWSPVIAQYGHSVYGLLGANVSKGQINALIARRREKRLTHRVLDNHGMTDDGRIWLSYRLSKAASTYAVITVPAALKKTVRGRFKLLDSDDRQIGTLATKDGRAWGLGAFMRQNGARVGDYVVVTLDLMNRTATVELGAEPPK